MSFNTQNYWTEMFAFVSTILIPVPVLLSNALQYEYIKVVIQEMKISVP